MKIFRTTFLFLSKIILQLCVLRCAQLWAQIFVILKYQTGEGINNILEQSGAEIDSDFYQITDSYLHKCIDHTLSIPYEKNAAFKANQTQANGLGLKFATIILEYNLTDVLLWVKIKHHDQNTQVILKQQDPIKGSHQRWLFIQMG